MSAEEPKSTGAATLPPRPSRSRWRKFLRGTERLLACVGLCFIASQFTVQMHVIVTPSMAPALQGTSYDNGDRVLMEKVMGWFRPPRRWEIYFFYNAEGSAVAKRIVGLPGEKIAVRNNRIFINGVEIQPPAALRSNKYYAVGRLTDGKEADCGQGYFTLGDDSEDSYDSRFLGPVPRTDFHGRAWLILWPWSRAGFVR